MANYYLKITPIYGFNYIENDLNKEVNPNTEIFIRTNGIMTSLGTLASARERVVGQKNVIGVDGVNYGIIGTPTIDDNLFMRTPPPSLAPLPSAGKKPRSKSKKLRSKSKKPRSKSKKPRSKKN